MDKATQISVVKSDLVRVVEEKLPDFAKACKSDAQQLIYNQVDFAPEFEVSEMNLLGLAIKYAGMHGKNITILNSGK